jgi:phosphoribosylformylglycinamidine synthase I
MKPKALVLKVAGTNCDLETCYAFEAAGADWELIHINQILSGEKKISDFNTIALAGGFSYGDDISAAKVLATKIKAYLMDDLKAALERGVPIIGICNGFQVLVKTGLLPGDGMGDATLFFNDTYKFEDRWVYLRPSGSKCIFTDGIKAPIYLPIAHMEGKYMAEDEGINNLESGNRVVFRYAKKDGGSADEKFPDNPNGSLNDIAGITDETGLILGMMPHPERHLDPTNHPRWPREGIKKTGDGCNLFENAVKFIKSS